MYHLRASPQYVHEINSTSKMVNDLLKRSISNAYRHDLNLKPGRLNNADGNCLWEAIIYNMLYRECFRRKSKETSKQLRKRSLDQAQAESHRLPFIESNTTEADWNHIRQDKIYETKLGDICIVAAARAIKKDIMIFNTDNKFALAPITLIGAKDYEGGQLTDENPIILGYNGTHFESLETLSIEDVIRAKELVQLIKSNNYKLDKTHIQNMARVSHNKANTTKEIRDKAKVTQGEHGENKYKNKCKNCHCSYEAKMDLIQHNAKVHAQHHCIICKEQKYGENNLNDHTKECREKRDKKRKEDDKKYKERKQAQPTYTNCLLFIFISEPYKNI